MRKKISALSLKIVVALMLIMGIGLTLVLPGAYSAQADAKQLNNKASSTKLLLPKEFSAQTDEPEGLFNFSRGSNYCFYTTKSAFLACKHEITDDFWIGVGNCNNFEDDNERTQCYEDILTAYIEGKDECKAQKEARLELCEKLGENRYDPRLDEIKFVDPSLIGSSIAPNPYFPMVPGTKRVFETIDASGEPIERITVEVKDETKTIEYQGVQHKCAIINDVVEEIEMEEGEINYYVIEDTDDWYIQEESGTVWYMGEIVENKELDLDGKAELIDLEGSWKAGVEYAKPGILMQGNPDPASVFQNPYRQEMALGEAEDVAEVIGFIPSITVRGVTYNNILKTNEYTPTEPGLGAYKYYAPGIGVILEEEYEDGIPTGERVELLP
jgi:hypothetical protein